MFFRLFIIFFLFVRDKNEMNEGAQKDEKK